MDLAECRQVVLSQIQFASLSLGLLFLRGNRRFIEKGENLSLSVRVVERWKRIHHLWAAIDLDNHLFATHPLSGKSAQKSIEVAMRIEVPNQSTHDQPNRATHANPALRIRQCS